MMTEAGLAEVPALPAKPFSSTRAIRDSRGGLRAAGGRGPLWRGDIQAPRYRGQSTRASRYRPRHRGRGPRRLGRRGPCRNRPTGRAVPCARPCRPARRVGAVRRRSRGPRRLSRRGRRRRGRAAQDDRDGHRGRCPGAESRAGLRDRRAASPARRAVRGRGPLRGQSGALQDDGARRAAGRQRSQGQLPRRSARQARGDREVLVREGGPLDVRRSRRGTDRTGRATRQGQADAHPGRAPGSRSAAIRRRRRHVDGADRDHAGGAVFRFEIGVRLTDGGAACRSHRGHGAVGRRNPGIVGPRNRRWRAPCRRPLHGT